MSNSCHGGEVAPNTFAAQDPWGQLYLSRIGRPRKVAGVEVTREDESELQDELDKITSLERSVYNDPDYTTRRLGTEALETTITHESEGENNG